MLARFLDVRAGESRALLLLGGHFFMLLAATTVLTTAAETIFLGALPYAWVPYTYIAGAGVTVVGAVAYGRGTSRLSPGRLSVVATLAVLLVLGLLLLCAVLAPGLGAFLLPCVIPGFGVIVGMESAGLVTRTLDPRQARRLYPAISGIGGIGAMTGALLVAWLTPRLGNLVVAGLGGVFLLGALPAALRVREVGAREGQARAARAEPDSWTAMFRNRFSTSLVVLVCVSGVLSTCAKFGLSAAVKSELPEVEIGPFLGRLYAGLNAMSIVFGFIVSRRIIARAGVGLALVIYPLVLGVMGVGGLLLPGLGFAAGALFSERLFRQNLQRPLLAISTMPLSPGLAARTNIAIRGAVENPAVVLTSLVLLGVGAALPWRTVFIGIALFGALGLWAALRARRAYLGELMAALRTRSLRTDGERVQGPALGGDARRLIHDHLRSETPDRAALALELLHGIADAETLAIIRARFGQWTGALQQRALMCLSVDPPRGAAEFIAGLDVSGRPAVHARQLASGAWTPPRDTLESALSAADVRVAGAAARRLAGEGAESTLSPFLERWAAREEPAWQAAALEGAVLLAQSAHAPLDARWQALANQSPEAALRGAPRAAHVSLAPLYGAHVGEERFGAEALEALAYLAETSAHREQVLAALAGVTTAGAPRRAALQLVLHAFGAEGRRHVGDQLTSERRETVLDAAYALGHSDARGTQGTAGAVRALSVSERQAVEREGEALLVDLERLGVLARSTAAPTRLVQDASRVRDGAFADLWVLLDCLLPGKALRRIGLSLGSGDSRERSFAIEAFDEALEAPWRERVLRLLDPQRAPTSGPDETDTHDGAFLARFGLTESRQPLPESIAALAAAPPFADWTTSALRALQDRTRDAGPGPRFRVTPSGYEGLREAILGEETSADVSAEGGIAMQAVWDGLAARPKQAGAWLAALGSLYLEPERPAPDISMSEASLASRPKSDDLEVHGDLALWQRIFYLRLVPMLGELPAPRLRAVAGIARQLRVPAGTRVIRASRPPGHAYIVCRGTFDVLVDGRHVGELRAGEACGVLALIAGRSHPTTVVAREEGEVLAIDRVDFCDVIEAHPGVLRSLSHAVALRKKI